MSVVVYQQDGKSTVWQEWIAVFGTVSNDDAGKYLTLVLGQTVPKFTGKRHFADINITVGFFKQLSDEVFIHRRLTTMGIEVTCCEFDGLA